MTSRMPARTAATRLTPERLADGGGEMTGERLGDVLESAIYAFGIAQQEVGRAYREHEDDDAVGEEADEITEWQRFASAQRDRALTELRQAIGSHLAHRPREAVAWETERAGSELAANAYDPMRHRQLSGCAHSITETCDQCHCPTCGQPVVVMTAQHEGAKPFYVPLNAVLVDLRSTPPAPA